MNLKPFAAWVALASALAGIGSYEAYAQLVRDHNDFGDSDYVIMGIAWLALALAFLLLRRRSLGPMQSQRFIEPAGAAAPPMSRLSAASSTLGSASSRTAEWETRKAFFNAAAGLTSYLGDDVDGLTFFVSTSDKGRGRLLFTKKTLKEWRPLSRALAHLDALGLGQHSRERVFIDVGANIGTPCIPAVRQHGFRRALALEPEPENFRLLRANVAINLLEDRIESHRVAASRTGGTVQLVLRPGKSGHHSVQPPKPGQPSLEVEAVALDHLLRQLTLAPEDIGLLWVDVEGHETEVLLGASTLLRARVPIVVEVTRRSAALLPLVAPYSHFADLRANGPVTSISALERLIVRLRGKDTTDILLVP